MSQNPNIKARIVVAILTLSMGGFVAITSSEGYVEKAMIPTKGDRPTIGYGSTFHENGQPVKMGDTTTPARALIKAQAHIGKEEKIFRASLPGVAMHQEEYDLYMDFVYQYGTGNWSASSMRRNLLAGNYRASCESLLLYRKSAGFDCSTPGNRVCAGVWTRQLERHANCVSYL